MSTRLGKYSRTDTASCLRKWIYTKTAAKTTKFVRMKTASVRAKKWTQYLPNTKQETWHSALPLESHVGHITFLHWQTIPMVSSARCFTSQNPLQVSALPITKILAKKVFAMTRNTFSKTFGPYLRCTRSRMIRDGDSFVARQRIKPATMSRKRNGEYT
jgi:hypothetical protein